MCKCSTDNPYYVAKMFTDLWLGLHSLTSHLTCTFAAGTDFEAFRMNITFASGEEEVMVVVPLKDDVFPEQIFESFEVTLGASPGVLIGSPSFVNFTITDDDPPLPGKLF